MIFPVIRKEEEVEVEDQIEEKISFFGLKNYPVKQIQMQKVGPNHHKNRVILLRFEAGPIGASGGLKHMCDDYLR